MIARHGARTPLTHLPRNGLDAYVWNCGPFFSTSNSGVIADNSSNSLFHYRTVSVPNKLNGDCIMGQLTIKGMQQMYAVGERFRERYVDMSNTGAKLLNASDFEGATDKIYVRSTDITSRRTEQSALYFMMGFVPEIMRRRYELSIDLAERSRETMYPHEGSCKRLKQLVRANRDKIQEYKDTEQAAQYDLHLRRSFGLVTEEEYTQQYDQLTQKHRPLEKVIPFEGADTGGDVVLADVADEVPRRKDSGESDADAELRKEAERFRVERLHNTLCCIVFDGKPLPAGLTEQDLSLVHKHISEYARIRFDGKELSRLAIGRFIGELLQAQKSTIVMHDQFDTLGTDALVTSPSQRIFEAYFAHDTTLIPITKAFDNYFEWPPFASNIVLELYKKRTPISSSSEKIEEATQNEYFVKFLYNDRPMNIPECDRRLSGSDRSHLIQKRLYPYDIWYEVANELVPEDYAKECDFCPNTKEE